MKRAVALAAAAGFAVVLALARQGHPAAGVPSTSSSKSGVAGSTASSSHQSREGDDDDSPLQGGSLASPSGGTPPVASQTS